jgi:uncharacterized membrane protein
LCESFGESEVIIKHNRINNVLQAKDWIKDGWKLFKKKPLTWVLMVLIFSIIFMVGGNNLVGRYIVALILPVLAGGIYLAAHKSSHDEPISIENLFSIFKKPEQLKQLLIIGGVGMLVVTLSYVIQSFLGHDGYDPGRKMGINVGRHLGSTSLSGLLGMLVSWAWSFALLFGVPLVVIKNEQAIPALKSSLKASLTSFIPLVAFYIMTIILFVLAIIPFGLGLLVLVPVIFCASYSAFKTVYLDDN